MIILFFLLSLVPAIVIYLWLRRRKKEDMLYRDICKRALIRGALLSPVFVMVLCALLYIIEKGMVLLGVGTVIVGVYHDFILFALAEEFVKYLMLKGLIKKNPYPYTWLDITSLMMIIGTGFQITEEIAYLAGAGAGMVLLRGITVMHCGYGFIMGYFVGKGMKTGKKRYPLTGFMAAFLLHGAYNCCLSDVLTDISDKFSYISLALAVVAIITLVVAVLHIRTAGKHPEYTERLDINA